MPDLHFVLERLELGRVLVVVAVDAAQADRALLICHARNVGWRIDPEGVETRVLRKLAPVAGLRVLEVGCGDGRVTFRYASDAASVLALDPDEGRIKKARAALKPGLAGKITFLVAGAADVDASHESFDLALFSSSL